jgi:hypothetical protein
VGPVVGLVQISRWKFQKCDASFYALGGGRPFADLTVETFTAQREAAEAEAAADSAKAAADSAKADLEAVADGLYAAFVTKHNAAKSVSLMAQSQRQNKLRRRTNNGYHGNTSQ